MKVPLTHRFLLWWKEHMYDPDHVSPCMHKNKMPYDDNGIYMKMKCLDCDEDLVEKIDE